jgi:hypothetical protein
MVTNKCIKEHNLVKELSICFTYFSLLAVLLESSIYSQVSVPNPEQPHNASTDFVARQILVGGTTIGFQKPAMLGKLLKANAMSDGVESFKFSFQAKFKPIKIVSIIDTFQYKYDSLDRLLTELKTSPQSSTEKDTYSYDNYGHISQVSGEIHTDSGWILSWQEIYVNDQTGKLTEIRHYSNFQMSLLANLAYDTRLFFNYDVKGNLIMKLQQSGIDTNAFQDEEKDTFEYDATNNMIKQTEFWRNDSVKALAPAYQYAIDYNVSGCPALEYQYTWSNSLWTDTECIKYTNAFDSLGRIKGVLTQIGKGSVPSSWREFGDRTFWYATNTMTLPLARYTGPGVNAIKVKSVCDLLGRRIRNKNIGSQFLLQSSLISDGYFSNLNSKKQKTEIFVK